MKADSKPRDKMSLVFRRACIMLTEEFAAAQKAESTPMIGGVPYAPCCGQKRKRQSWSRVRDHGSSVPKHTKQRGMGNVFASCLNAQIA
mmetsp:Transcript_27421/g.53913  ORF Transcript_27421/g.53913 Transcript_27421/m.53913 type:complete len:89 (+) Transcript_27421:1168-1434(+)